MGTKRGCTSGLWGLMVFYFLTWVMVILAFYFIIHEAVLSVYSTFQCDSSIKTREKRSSPPSRSLTLYLLGTAQAGDLHPAPYPGVAVCTCSLWSLGHVPQTWCQHPFLVQESAQTPALIAPQNCFFFFLNPTNTPL